MKNFRKAIIFLPDGMADDPLPELNGKTPLGFANTPAMDSIAAKGASGTFLTLPDLPLRSGLCRGSSIPAEIRALTCLPHPNWSAIRQEG